MASDAPTPPRTLRGPLVLVAAALAGAALAGGSLLLAERLRRPEAASAARPAAPAAVSTRAADAPPAAGSQGTTEAPPPGAVPGAPVRPAPAPRWRCPMHPRVVRAGPGACPICGMPLVKEDEGAGDR